MRGLRWFCVCVAVLAFSYGALDAAHVHRQQDCPLGMEFERSGSELVRSRSFPPMAECRYEYRTTDGSDLFPPETVTHDALPSLIVAAGVFVIAAAVVPATFTWDRRSAEADAELWDRARTSAQQ